MFAAKKIKEKKKSYENNYHRRCRRQLPTSSRFIRSEYLTYFLMIEDNTRAHEHTHARMRARAHVHNNLITAGTYTCGYKSDDQNHCFFFRSVTLHYLHNYDQQVVTAFIWDTAVGNKRYCTVRS